MKKSILFASCLLLLCMGLFSYRSTVEPEIMTVEITADSNVNFWMIYDNERQEYTTPYKFLFEREDKTFVVFTSPNIEEELHVVLSGHGRVSANTNRSVFYINGESTTVTTLD